MKEIIQGQLVYWCTGLREPGHVNQIIYINVI